MKCLAIYFLDVGQGDCSFIVPPEGEGDPILIDCADDTVALEFVRAHGIERLEAVVISHLDEDHISGMLNFLMNFTQTYKDGLGVLYIDRDRAVEQINNGKKGELLDWALAWVENHRGLLGAPRRDGKAPKIISEGKDWKVHLALPYHHQVLKQLRHEEYNSNEFSTVLRVERAGGSVLIGADAPLASWRQLEERDPGSLRANIIRIPHHGGHLEDQMTRERLGREATSLYEKVGARTAVCSVGTNNPYGHPFEEHLRAAQRGGACRLLCTQLTERCHSKPQALKDKARRQASGVFLDVRHQSVDTEVPCAGSIMITIDITGRIRVTPSPSETSGHTKFLENVKDRLCKRPALSTG